MRSDPFAEEMERLGPATADRASEAPPSEAFRRLRHNRHRGPDEKNPWPEPDLVLLGTGRRPAPAFPLPLLGPWAEWVGKKANAASAPADYVGVALLVSVGAALANVRWPVAGAGWSEPPVLWGAEVGPPSSAKSPSMDAAFELVRFAEERMAQGFEAEQQDYAIRKQASEAHLDAWKAEVKAAVKNGDRLPPMPAEAQEPAAPVRPRIRVADATVEALGSLAAGLPRGLLLVRDELAGWLGAFDKYGGGGSDRAFAIEMYGGRSYVVDRMKNPEPLRIRHLSIGVLGGVQPEKLSVIIDGPDDGLASRLLWAWPDAAPNFTLARTLIDDAPAQQAFNRLTELAMGTDQFGYPEPKRLRLTTEAEDVLEAFARDMTRRAQDASGLFAGTLGKARGHALRLSAVLEHLWWCSGTVAAEPTEISVRAIEAAAGLLDGYFIPMAERVFGDASIPKAERRAMVLARHLRRSGEFEFNAREVRREVGGLLRDAADMDAACAVLVEAGLLRPKAAQGAGVGRKPKNYEVNPAVFRRLS